MDVFSGALKSGIVNATYFPVGRKTPLGTVQGDHVGVEIIIDEGSSTNFANREQTTASDVLVYARPESVLGDISCNGGRLDVGNRSYRIESFDVAKNQRTGVVMHIELTCEVL